MDTWMDNYVGQVIIEVNVQGNILAFDCFKYHIHRMASVLYDIRFHSLHYLKKSRTIMCGSVQVDRKSKAYIVSVCPSNIFRKVEKAKDET
jgi:hypothetical protein